MLPDSLPYMKSDEAIARQLSELNKKVELLDSQRSGANRLIDGVVLPAGAATITFANIPIIYDHLLLLYYIRTDGADSVDTLHMRFNADAGNNYDYNLSNTALGGVGFGAAVAVNFIFITQIPGALAPANTYDMGRIRINSYVNATNHKSTMSQYTLKAVNAIANLMIGWASGWWRNNAAITTITLFSGLGANIFGRVDLYGIQGVE